LSERYHKYLRNESTTRKNLESYISQAEAARIRGVSQQAIADLIRRGRLTTVSVADRTLVLRSEVEAFVPQSRTGRPPKEKTGMRTPKEVLGKTKTSTKAAARTHKEDLEKYISRAEAARIRGVSQPAIVDLIHRGRLRTVNVAGKTLLFRSEVEGFVPQPRTGRPPKSKIGTNARKKGKPKK
jgi:excisionase family DNA binding protein